MKKSLTVNVDAEIQGRHSAMGQQQPTMATPVTNNRASIQSMSKFSSQQGTPKKKKKKNGDAIKNAIKADFIKRSSQLRMSEEIGGRHGRNGKN